MKYRTMQRLATLDSGSAKGFLGSRCLGRPSPLPRQPKSRIITIPNSLMQYSCTYLSHQLARSHQYPYYQSCSLSNILLVR